SFQKRVAGVWLVQKKPVTERRQRISGSQNDPQLRLFRLKPPAQFDSATVGQERIADQQINSLRVECEKRPCRCRIPGLENMVAGVGQQLTGGSANEVIVLHDQNGFFRIKPGYEGRRKAF